MPSDIDYGKLEELFKMYGFASLQEVIYHKKSSAQRPPAYPIVSLFTILSVNRGQPFVCAQPSPFCLSRFFYQLSPIEFSFFGNSPFFARNFLKLYLVPEAFNEFSGVFFCSSHFCPCPCLGYNRPCRFAQFSFQNFMPHPLVFRKKHRKHVVSGAFQLIPLLFLHN